jgi:sorbitol-specific phosphotransferase system component IIC
MANLGLGLLNSTKLGLQATLVDLESLHVVDVVCQGVSEIGSIGLRRLHVRWVIVACHKVILAGRLTEHTSALLENNLAKEVRG